MDLQSMIQALLAQKSQQGPVTAPLPAGQRKVISEGKPDPTAAPVLLPPQEGLADLSRRVGRRPAGSPAPTDQNYQALLQPHLDQASSMGLPPEWQAIMQALGGQQLNRK